MLKRIVSLLLCAVMMISFLPAQALAEENVTEPEGQGTETVLPEETTLPEESEPETEEEPEIAEADEVSLSSGIVDSGVCGDDLTWTLDMDGVLIISGTGPMSFGETVPWWENEYSIHSVIIEHGITTIGDHAFDSCGNLGSIVIPDTVTSIGDWAFQYCKLLKNVVIPDNVTRIGDGAFYQCEGIKDLSLPSALKTIGNEAFAYCQYLFQIAIPDGVTKIGAGAFKQCYLQNLVIPGSVKSVGDEAFANNYFLETIVFSEGLTSIGEAVLSGCSNMKQITIPASVTDIAPAAFKWCHADELVVSDENPRYDCSENVLFDRTNKALLWCAPYKEGETYQVPDGTISIAEYAFDQCRIENIVFPESLISIGNSAFSNCNLFLSSVAFPENLESIGALAFENCGNLSEMVFSGNAPSFGENCFRGVTATACCPADDATWTADVMQDYGGSITWVPNDGTETEVPTEPDVPEVEPTIPAESEPTVPEEPVPEEPTTPAPEAPIPATVKVKLNVREEPSVYASALEVLEAGTKVEIYEITVVNEVQWARIAQGWVLMEYLTLDGSSDEVASGICGEALNWEFDGSTGRLTISGTGDMWNFEAENTPWDSYTDKIVSIVVKEGVQSIGEEAFRGCGALTSVSLPEGLRAIGESSFLGCHSLHKIQLPETLTILGNQAFFQCEQLESIYIPASVTQIGDIPFGICENLTAITVDPANQYYCNDENGYLFSKDKTVLYQVLTNISGSYTVPDSVTRINRLAFDSCRFLTELTIPDSVTEIGDCAFGTCTSLKTIHLPNRLTELEYGFLADCRALERITIPGAVEVLGNSILAGNIALTEIYFEGSAPKLSEKTFLEVTAKAYYPANNPTWTADVMQNYGGSITWVPYDAPETEEPVEPDESTSGICGDGLFWSFDKETGKLTISGDGYWMYSYSELKPAPWSQYAAQIRELSLSDSIGTIGSYAFANCTGLTSVVLPGADGSLYLEKAAFAGCTNLREITFQSGITHPIRADIFTGVTAKVYYPAGYGWNESKQEQFGENLTWIEYGEDAVMLSFYTACVRVGTTFTSTVEAHPAKATADCTFIVSDPSVLRIVSQDRKSVTYEGLRPGRTMVTVTDQNTGLSVTREVLVYDSKEISFPYTESILMDASPIVRSYTVTPTETAKYLLMTNDVNAPGWDACGISVLCDGEYVPSLDWYWGEGVIRQITELTAGKTYEIELQCLHPELGATATVEFRKAGTEITSIDIQQEVISAPVSENSMGWASVAAYPLDAYLDRSDIQWSIKDTDIAEVESSGEIECGIRGKKPGTTELTVRCGDFTDTAIIHVYDAQTIHLDETVELSPIPGSTYNWRDVLFTPEKDGRYVFTVTNDGILKPHLSYDYADGEVYCGYGDGIQTLSVELKAGESFVLQVHETPFSGTCTVTVNQAAEKATGMKLVYTRNTPDRVEFGVQFTPATAAENVVKWEVSNPSLLGQSRGDGDPHNNQAYFTPYGTGRVTVTATSESGLTASFTVVVGQCLNGHRYSDFAPILDGLGNPTGEEYRTCYRCDTIEQRHVRPAATSGICGDNLTWEFDADTGTLTITGYGAMYDFGWDTMPWKAFKEQIQTVQLPEGLTTLGTCAFTTCHNLTSINLPYSLTTISNSALEECHSLTSLTIPGSVKHIGTYAFSGAGLTELTLSEGLETIDMYAFMSCVKLKEVVLPQSLKHLGGGAFQYCIELETAQLPETLNTVSWHTFNECTSLKEITIPKTVTEISYFAFNSCTALNAVEFEGPAPSAGEPCPFNSVTADAWYPADDSSWTDETMQRLGADLKWIPTGVMENCVVVDLTELDGAETVWVDGVEYPVCHRDSRGYIFLPDSRAKTMVTHAYHVDDPGDVHTQYPVSMKVWMLENQDGVYTAIRQEAFDDILQYSGMSIRVYGKKGIRMITSMEQSKKKALTGDGLNGYTLQEYGTVIAWTEKLGDGNPLVLGRSYSKSNYAYKRGIADPIFQNTGNLMQYTNVLVNFSNEQCKNDIALRPYMILKDASGNRVTIYGGIVTRSIGYIAYQNRNVFEPGTDEYEYIWDIIHYVYGSIYDDEYRKVWTPPVM